MPSRLGKLNFKAVTRTFNENDYTLFIYKSQLKIVCVLLRSDGFARIARVAAENVGFAACLPVADNGLNKRRKLRLAFLVIFLLFPSSFTSAISICKEAAFIDTQKKIMYYIKKQIRGI